jgi:hypothetical protein
MHTFRGSFSLNCWINTSLLFNQIVLSSITKKGETESASRLLIILVIMTMQFGRINAFNKMCAGLQELINVNTQRKAFIFLWMVLNLNWRFNFNFQFEFEFRKHRTIKRDVVGLSRFATSASLDLLSSFLRVKTLENSLEKPKSALK